MDVSPVIRAALANDAKAVLDLWQQAAAEPTHTDNLESLRQLIARDPGALIVAELDNRLIGSIIAAFDGWRGSVYRLVVAPSHRRRGLGTRLLNEAESRLASLGAVRLQAVVVETDHAALGFWQESGWHQQTERLRFTKG